MNTARHLLALTLLASPLLTPFARLATVACTHDGHLHYHRVAALRHAWSNGLYFSRWLPDLAFGLGYPFFIYREPLPLYLASALHALGLPLPAASNLLYALTIVGGGAFTYLWVRDIFDDRAGLVAGVAYMAAPYVLVDALVRGNLVESVGLALMPLLCWSGRRFVRDGRPAPFLITTLGLAALSLSHNISLLLFTPFLLVYLSLVGWLAGLSGRRLLSRLILLLGIGLGLTAWHTGTALLELGEVTITQSTTTRNNDFRFNFASLAEILAPVAPEDPTLLNPPLPFRLGWVPLVLGLLGLLAGLAFRARERRTHALFMAAAVVTWLFFALPISRPLWETLPLIDFVQFPWRFVGRAALPLAFLAGAPFALPLRHTRRRSPDGDAPGRLAFVAPQPLAPLLIAVTLLIVEAVPLLYPRLCNEDPFPSIGDVHAYEHETGLVGVDPEGSYFPTSVQRRPGGSPLEADYRDGREPQRFDAAALPTEAAVESYGYMPLGAAIRLTSPAPFTARYFTFAFPGWQAMVDGRPVPITPSDPEGFITFPVPAGTHTIKIGWTLTPSRLALALVSVAAALGLVGIAAGVAARHRPAPGRVAARPRFWRSAGAADWWLLAGLGALLLAGKLLVDRLETPLRQPTPPPVTRVADVQGGELRLAGHSLSRTTVPAGETLDVDLAWLVLAPPGVDYQSNLWLAGPDDTLWSDKETHRPRLYEDPGRTRFWSPGQWAWDSRELRVLPGTPPGEYELVLTLFDRETLQPVTLTAADGRVLGPTAVVDRITVTRPATPPPIAPQFPTNYRVGELLLQGYNLDRATAAPGDPLLLTFFWQRTAATPADRLTLTLRDPEGVDVATWSLPPARVDYPPARWLEDEIVRGQHALRLPPALESGVHRLVLESVPLGDLIVNAPERVMTPPPVGTVLDIPFGEAATLVGYTTTRGEDELVVDLVWRGERPVDTAYRVFVHLIGPDGAIVAQSDGEPAGWQRPTTGWLPGEHIVDTHRLSLPDGPFTLRAGLYDPATGARLPTLEGDSATLPP